MRVALARRRPIRAREELADVREILEKRERLPEYKEQNKNDRRRRDCRNAQQQPAPEFAQQHLRGATVPVHYERPLAAGASRFGGYRVHTYNSCLLLNNGNVSQILDDFAPLFGEVERYEVVYRRTHLRVAVCEHKQGSCNRVFARDNRLRGGQNSVYREGLYRVVDKAESDVGDCVFGRSHAGLRLPVRADVFRALDYRLFAQDKFVKRLVCAAVRVAGDYDDFRVVAAELLPVRDFTGVDVGNLRVGQSRDFVGGVDDNRQAVESNDVGDGQDSLFDAGLEFGILHEAGHIRDVARAVDEALYAVAAAGFADCRADAALFLIIVGERLGNRADGRRAVEDDVFLGSRGGCGKSRRRKND